MIICTDCRRAQPMRCTMCVAVNPTPAWLDAPDGPGWFWLRRNGAEIIVEVHGTIVYGSQKAWLLDELTQSYLGWQWQRVAPPRDG